MEKIILRLPVEYSSDDALEEMGIATQGVDGYLYVHPEHITAHNDDTEGATTMRLSSGQDYRVMIEHKEFIKALKKIEYKVISVAN